MYERPEHLVWIEIAGILGLLAVLLGPLAFLATEMMGGGGRGGGVVGNVSGGPPPAAAQGGLQTPAVPTPVPGLSPGGARAEVPSTPFSKSWREQATPSLTGPDRSDGGAGLAGSGGGGDLQTTFGPSGRSGGTPDAGRASGDRRASGATFGRGGPDLALRGGARPSGGGRAARAARDEQNGSARSEARQLAGRMRALSGQLRQMDSSPQASSSAQQSTSDPGSPDDPDRRNPGSPSDVPIGDHLHWLAVAGILWGAWRIGRGA